MRVKESNKSMDDGCDEAFAFGFWQTPFENSDIELLHVEYMQGGKLTIRIRAENPQASYRVAFERIAAFRVLDEHGLLQLWEKTTELGTRPALRTFMARNHLWTKESPITFLMSEGWSYFIVSHFECVEIVSSVAPSITEI